jgi:hypothetical protein
MADLGAAFGFYPQLNRRRQGSPADSANLPIDVLRGRLAGLLGAPADIANLLRSPSPTEMFGDTSYEAPAQFPYTTEKFLKDLPLAPTSRVGQVAGQAASFVPLNPMPAVRGVQKIGQMAGEELAATMMGQRPNSMMSKVVPQPLFAVAPEQGLLSARAEPIESLLQVKPQAPVSDIGFYSATEQAALNLGRNKGTGQSFINDLMKAPDVKKEELAYTGLDDFLRDKPNVTKQEVQDFLANNRVDVQEVRLGDAPPPAPPPVLDAERLNLLEKEFSQLKEHPIDAPNFGQEKFEELMMLQNIRDNSTVESLYSRADSATSAAQRAQSRGNKDIAERYFREAEMLNSRAEALDLKGLGVPEQVITNPTKFDKYTLAGGENYREILLTLPNKPMDAGVAGENWYTQFIKRGGEPEWSQLTPVRQQEIINSMPAEARNYSTSPEYRSSHFNEPNILAHMRVNDRIDADGKKMLLVEEIQSDWHQAGREKGYRKADNEKALEVESKSITEERKNLVAELSAQEKQNGFVSLENQQRWDKFKEKEYSFNEKNKEFFSQVPDAPFKDTWYQLALKRLTKYAAENGYERIGLTTGKQQASRFDLSKQVDEIAVPMVNEDGSRSVRIDPTSGTSIKLMVDDKGIVTGYGAGSTQFSGKKLSEVIGKDIADKVMKADADTKFTGLDLSVGGEGMKKYYDEIYPKFLDKYGKKYGASVGETQITTDYARDASGIPAQRPSKETIRYLDITPQMKEGTSKGQPLFAATPLLPATSLLDEEKRKEITSLLE